LKRQTIKQNQKQEAPMAAIKRVVSAATMATALMFVSCAWGKDCVEPPIVKQEKPSKERTRAILMRVAADPGSARGELFLPMFLEKEDIKNGVRLTQDTRRYLPPDPDDRSFDKYCGYHAGLALWEGGFDRTIYRLVDIRYVFPTENEAKAYHADELFAKSEGQPEIPDAPKVGDECSVFGGNVKLMGVSLNHYYYIFRVQNVVVKLYACQGPDVVDPAETLTPGKVAKLAEICMKRVEDYNRAARGGDDGEGGGDGAE
jgi:hypothetical protein